MYSQTSLDQAKIAQRVTIEKLPDHGLKRVVTLLSDPHQLLGLSTSAVDVCTSKLFAYVNDADPANYALHAQATSTTVQPVSESILLKVAHVHFSTLVNQLYDLIEQGNYSEAKHRLAMVGTLMLFLGGEFKVKRLGDNRVLNLTIPKAASCTHYNTPDQLNVALTDLNNCPLEHVAPNFHPLPLGAKADAVSPASSRGGRRKHKGTAGRDRAPAALTTAPTAAQLPQALHEDAVAHHVRHLLGCSTKFDPNKNVDMVDFRNRGFTFTVSSQQTIDEDSIVALLAASQASAVNKLHLYQVVPHNLFSKIRHRQRVVDPSGSISAQEDHINNQLVQYVLELPDNQPLLTHDLL